MIPNKVYTILIDLFPMIILFSVVMIFVRIISLLYAHEKINILHEAKSLLYIIYCFALFHLITTTDFESFSNNFIPFKEMTRYQFSSVLFYRNVIGNILLFIPFGYLITDMIIDKAGKCKIWITMLITFVTSFTTEIIQMNIGRSFDIDDIILNFLGGILGYYIYKIIHALFEKIPDHWPKTFIKLLLFLFVLFVLSFILFKYCGVVK